MPSNYTPRSRLNLQATGENINLWGQILNGGGLELIDAAMDGVTTITAPGATILTTANGAADQARSRVLNVTAPTAAQITIPSVEKFYIVRAAMADVTITNGSNSLVVKAGDCLGVVTDGVSIWPVRSTDFGGARIKNVGSPQQPTDAVNKAYADGLSFATVLPDQAGNEGRYITTDGAIASWADPPEPTAAQIEGALGYTPAATDDVPVAATVAEIRTGNVAGKYIAPDAMASALATVAIAPAVAAAGLVFSGFINAEIVLTGNLTIGPPSAGFARKTGEIDIVQDGTGGRVLAFHADYIVPASFAPQTTANGRTSVPYRYQADGKVRLYNPSKWSV